MEDTDGDRAHHPSLAAAEEVSVTTRRVRAYVGLGANIGDAPATLARAVAALADLPGTTIRDVSRLYVTAPVGVTDQPDFHNAVVAIEVPAGADPAAGAVDLLVGLKDIERAFGRQVRGRWGPREVDLDLLVFGRARLRVERPPAGRSTADESNAGQTASPSYLEVPHRDARERLFVLAPLADLAAGLVPPGWGETIETVRRRRATIEGPTAVRPVGTWDPVAHAWRRDRPDGPGGATTVKESDR